MKTYTLKGTTYKEQQKLENKYTTNKQTNTVYEKNHASEICLKETTNIFNAKY